MSAMGCDVIATPIEAVSTIRPPGTAMGSTSAACMRSTRWAASSGWLSSHTATNSSPPIRATVSMARITPLKRRAAWDEHHVAHSVAMRVVHRLEVIEVEVQHSHHLVHLPLLQATTGQVQAIQQQGTVREPSQGVVGGPTHELAVAPHPIGHLVDRGQPSTGSVTGAEAGQGELEPPLAVVDHANGDALASPRLHDHGDGVDHLGSVIGVDGRLPPQPQELFLAAAEHRCRSVVGVHDGGHPHRTDEPHGKGVTE